ncbi:MAG TPA: EF-Tu/IF-2/RF-3 family GTPase [Candidatus Thermoplasmatota archaeon]|nr:EF-Tu/IF-2/RF-3 family GTPase [Candidatus Thermoplasmatota archaeon]
MPAVTLGVLGNLDYARELGKKSSESDVQLITFKEGDTHVSMVVPFRYPEKVHALCYAVNAADALLIVVNAVNRDLGESIVAAAAAGHTRGLIVLQNYVQPEQIAPLLKGTTLAGMEITTDDKPASIRQKLVALASAPRQGPVRIPIDHHFNVKGVGTVILGFVKQGTIKKHDALRAYPSAKGAVVRSIQVHDTDVNEAHTGDHVGLALKNIENDDLDRGFVLAPEGTVSVADANAIITLKTSVSPFFRPGIKADGIYHLAHGWQVISCRAKSDLAAGKDGAVSFELSKPLAYDPGDRAVLVNLDNAAQRIVGSGTIG